MTTRKPRKAVRSRNSDALPPVSPKRALRMWGPSVRLHLGDAVAEAEDGMTTASILQKMAAGADTLDKKAVEMLARHLFFHFAKAHDKSSAALKMLGVVERGRWEAGSAT